MSRTCHAIVSTRSQLSHLVSRRLSVNHMIAVRRCFVVAIRVALFAATLSAGANAQRAPIVVIVVRHAEKDTLPPDDPPLTAAGAARALALDRALAAAGVQAVITTQLRRTRETARPIAERLGLVVQTVKRDEDITAHARAVAAAVLKEVGKTVLIVGHGETVGPIIAALGGAADPEPMRERILAYLRSRSRGRPRTIRSIRMRRRVAGVDRRLRAGGAVCAGDGVCNRQEMRWPDCVCRWPKIVEAVA